MGDTEENATQEIDEKCTNLHITSPPAMGPDNPPGGMDTAKKSQKNDPSSQEYTKAKAMARKAAVAAQASSGKRKTGKAVSKTVEAIVGINMDTDQSSLVGSTNFGGHLDDKFYITTAINYTNGYPHIGHAYEGVTADVIARYHRMHGQEVFFLTGTDEHGQKIANAAKDEGVKPIDISNKYATAFQELNKRLLISNDYFVRTTSEMHHLCSQKLWKKCSDQGDIYLGRYEGWYDVREEAFVSDKDAEFMDFKDTYGAPLKRMSEETYFFKISKYQDWLIKHIESSPSFIMPPEKRNNICTRLVDPLADLCISRTTFEWGIKVPSEFDQRHVMYVWFDALSNYLSAIHALHEPPSSLSKFWPANVHVIGKDITWFHCVIWPCILKSAGLPIPSTVFAHGFVAGADGRKMSKSLGNVVDPNDLCNSFPVDTLRWYFCREAPFGSDLSFSISNMIDAHNAELCDTLGNLANRCFSLCFKYMKGILPPPLSGSDYRPFDLDKLRSNVEHHMSTCALQLASATIMSACRDANKFINDVAPWLLKGDEHEATRKELVRVSIDGLYILAHFIAPTMPTAATALFTQCGALPRPITELKNSFDNLPPETTTLNTGKVLFNKIMANSCTHGGDNSPTQTADIDNTVASKSGGDSNANVKGATPTMDEKFSSIDIRVGRINKVWVHPEAEKLFCEEIDLGEHSSNCEGGVRKIASGLRAHYSLDEMDGRLVCVITNLKPAKLVGFVSQGMVLAAHDAKTGKVELVTPPEGSTLGERLFLKSRDVPTSSATPSQVSKKKLWQTLAPLLRVNSEGVAACDGNALCTSKGPCTVPTVTNGPIS